MMAPIVRKLQDIGLGVTCSAPAAHCLLLLCPLSGANKKQAHISETVSLVIYGSGRRFSVSVQTRAKKESVESCQQLVGWIRGRRKLQSFFCLKVDEGRVSRECECVCACIIMYEDEKERGKKKKSHLARTLNSYCACKEQEKGFKV